MLALYSSAWCLFPFHSAWRTRVCTLNGNHSKFSSLRLYNFSFMKRCLTSSFCSVVTNPIGIIKRVARCLCNVDIEIPFRRFPIHDCCVNVARAIKSKIRKLALSSSFIKKVIFIVTSYEWGWFACFVKFLNKILRSFTKNFKLFEISPSINFFTILCR